MTKILGLDMRNFWSVGNATQAIRLDADFLTLVLGNNGHGKTAMLQALSYGIYGEPLTNINLDNLINNINLKNMLVGVDLERDGMRYRIERGRKPNVLHMLVFDANGVPTDAALGENRHTQTEINAIIGMSHTLFQHIVALSTYTDPFLKMKPAQQREVIEELLGIMTLSQRDEALKKMISDIKEQTRAEDASLKATTEANGRIEVAIQRASAERDAWLIAHNIAVSRITAQVTEWSGIDFAAEIAAFDTLDAWIEQERQLLGAAEGEGKETDLLRRELAKIVSEQTRLKMDAGSSDDQIRRLEGEAARYLKDASSPATDHQAARLEAEARRFDEQAVSSIDNQLARMLSDAKRKSQEAEQRMASTKTKAAEMAFLQTEMTKTDHTCSTCGQGLNGTDHLAKVVAKLAEKVADLEAASVHDVAIAEKLQAEAGEIETETGRLAAEHKTAQEGWRNKAVQIRAEIGQVVAQYAVRQEEWRSKAAAIEGEIARARKHLAKRQAEVEQTIAQLDDDRAMLGVAISEREAVERDIIKSIQNLGPKPTVRFNVREEVWRLRQSMETAMRDLEHEMAKENPQNANIASLRSAIVEIDYTVLTELQDQLKHMDFIHKLLSGKESFIRKKIIDTNLLDLNRRLNHYLEALMLPHEVTFMPDLSVEITRLGRGLDFNQLSRGEMNRVTLATSWAFRDVWEKLNTTVNLMFIDELADAGMDDNGAELTFGVLNRMGRERSKNVFLISHKECLIGIADNLLKVHMENQFSRFEANAKS